MFCKIIVPYGYRWNFFHSCLLRRRFSKSRVYTGAKISSAIRDHLREYLPYLNYVSLCFDMIRRGSDRSLCSHCVGHNLAYRVGLVSECEFILIFNNSQAGEDTVCSEAILCSFFLCYRIAFVSRFRSYSFYLITPLISSSGRLGSQIRSILPYFVLILLNKSDCYWTLLSALYTKCKKPHDILVQYKQGPHCRLTNKL